MHQLQAVLLPHYEGVLRCTCKYSADLQLFCQGMPRKWSEWEKHGMDWTWIRWKIKCKHRPTFRYFNCKPTITFLFTSIAAERRGSVLSGRNETYHFLWSMCSWKMYFWLTVDPMGEFLLPWIQLQHNRKRHKEIFITREKSRGTFQSGHETWDKNEWWVGIRREWIKCTLWTRKTVLIFTWLEFTQWTV